MYLDDDVFIKLPGLPNSGYVPLLSTKDCGIAQFNFYPQ